jgi:hypothetical protein
MSQFSSYHFFVSRRSVLAHFAQGLLRIQHLQKHSNAVVSRPTKTTELRHRPTDLVQLKVFAIVHLGRIGTRSGGNVSTSTHIPHNAIGRTVFARQFPCSMRRQRRGLRDKLTCFSGLQCQWSAKWDARQHRAHSLLLAERSDETREIACNFLATATTTTATTKNKCSSFT